jgi:penicillin amidase
MRWGAADANRNTHAFELLNQATNWDEFQTAATYFDLAGQIWLYADVEGNIGYVTSGRIPIRAEGHDGSVPADGTVSDFEWQGFIDPMENPRIYNPESNYIVTANNAVISPEDFEPVITVDWDYGYRASRIETMMQAQDVHSLDSFAAMQFDSYNSAAALMMPELTPVDFGDDRLNEAVAWLGEWDLQNAADSPQAALFNVFWNEFVPMVFDETQNYGEDYNVYRLSLMLDVPEHPMWNNGVMETADPVVFMQAALSNALDYMESEYGDDWDAWRWGDLHIARFRAAPLGQLPEGVNPTLDAALPQIFRLFNREVGVSGGPSIVNATSWNVGSGDYTVTGHPSMRMIVDLSDLDNSRFVIPTGESGNPQNPHYDDMMALWANGEYHAHNFSLEAIEAATVQTWTLNP